jgi:hypothetical protein
MNLNKVRYFRMSCSSIKFEIGRPIILCIINLDMPRVDRLVHFKNDVQHNIERIEII